MLKTFIIVFCLLPGLLYAQAGISGRVINGTTKAPIADASVFLNNTGVGSKTNTDGSFQLNDVRNGQYDLVVSCIGYQNFHQSIAVSGIAPIKLDDILLIPKVTELNEVNIKYDANRDIYIRQFTREFLGYSANASQCTIINPELLDIAFNKKNNQLTASTDDFLIVENKALGYKVKFLLNSFLKDSKNGFVFYNGATIFEPMSGNARQQKKWKKKREETYAGSSMHFLRACINQTVDQEKFTVYRLIRIPNKKRPPDSLINARRRLFMPSTDYNIIINDSLQYWNDIARQPKYFDQLVKTPLKPNEYIMYTNRKGIYAMSFKDYLYVTFRKQDNRTTIIHFNKPQVYFDNNGVIINTDGCIFEGYWGNQRVADLLPVDYISQKVQ